MHKLIPAALALVVLSGCGTAAGPFAPKARTGAAQAQSAAGTAKGVRAMYKAAFKAADKNGNGYLILAEMPAALPSVAGAPAEQPADPAAVAAATKALFDQLDANKDKKVRWREFLSKATLETAVGTFRAEATRAFSALDKNSDHQLSAEELAGGPVTPEQADLNKNGRVTLGEFEDALAAKLVASPDPVDPPAPPAPGGDTPPAPPAPAPGENPAPAPTQP